MATQLPKTIPDIIGKKQDFFYNIGSWPDRLTVPRRLFIPALQ